MSDKIRRNILSNVSYVLSAQVLIMIVGIIRSLILPAFFSVSFFGYWVVYLFYTDYVGLFCLGYYDGIYLRYGEYDYKDLPYPVLRPANRLYFLQLLLLSCIAIGAISLFVTNDNVRFAMNFSAMNIVFVGLYVLLIRILQITNQFKRYSFFSVIDKIFVLIAVVFMFMTNKSNFKIIILVDILSKIGIVSVMIWKTKELWFGKTIISQVNVAREYRQNISTGIKLMVANLMSMLLVGAGKLMVQMCGNIEEFGMYSFGITVTGLVVTAITAFSLVLYPILKRLSQENYASYFDRINTFTRSFCVISLLFYFPAYWLILIFYAKYSDVLVYLNILFGIVFLQGKISILNNTFYKALRDEKSMLYANMSCIVLFMVLVFIGYKIQTDVYIIALSTFIAMLLLCYFSEIYLLKRLGRSFDFKLIYEIIFLILFILVSSFCNVYVAAAVYLLLCLLYFWMEYTKIYETAMILLKK